MYDVTALLPIYKVTVFLAAGIQQITACPPEIVLFCLNWVYGVVFSVYINCM